jgi:Mg2+/Co2+ transporter CorB
MTVAPLVVLLLVIAVLIFVSALFSGLEIALFSLKPHQLRRLEQNHRSLTQFIQVFRENPRRVFNLLLLGDGLVNVPLVILCLVLIWEVPWGRHIPQWVSAVVIFTVVVVVCDLIPKLLAQSAPYRLSALGAFTLQMSLPLLNRVGDAL